MKRPRINLGDKARDTITGFTGTVVCISEWISGCLRITVQGTGLHEGKPTEPQCFDCEQMEVVEPKVVPVCKPTGGPCPSPTRNKD